MAQNDHPGFDQKAIDGALEAAQRYADSLRSAGVSGGKDISLDDGELKLGAQCITATVANHQICITLPLGIGKKCFPIPTWVPGGATVQVCLDICTKWGVPCGVEVTASFNGTRIFQKGFGCC